MANINYDREDLKVQLENIIDGIIFDIQNKENITDGEADMDLVFDLDEKTEALTDSILAIIEYQKSIMKSIPVEKVEEEYCPSSDTTFLVKYTYINEELKSREVISFYSGEPNKKDTDYYIGTGKGTKCEYTL